MIVELCEHGEAKAHKFVKRIHQTFYSTAGYEDCPGGRVLEQAIIWWCLEHDCGGNHLYCHLIDMAEMGLPNPCRMVKRLLVSEDALASAQENPNV